MGIDLNEIAKKWQKKWGEEEIFKVNEDSKKEKYYVLEMFPYPSGKLHMGHARNYSIGDCIARFKRMHGYNVLYPMGFDAFGLPAENAAIDHNADPKEWTYKRMDDMVRQLKELGYSYDWDRRIATCIPEYYKWNQLIFLKMLKKGLAYKKKSSVNWCEKCHTVLANEQVVNGKCWRHGDEDVIEKNLDQWFFKITAYADELLADLDKLKEWPERVKTMQKNWIGKSQGIEIFFKVKDSDKVISTFTTRPDTVFGITYLVFAPEHPMVMELVKGTEYELEVKNFIKEVSKKTEIERTAEGKEKNGLFIGKYFINPVNNEVCPIFVADYALAHYGTGAVMAVPTHDQRDFEFAEKYGLQKKVVISPKGKELNSQDMAEAFTDDGVLVNSGEFNGLPNKEAILKISKWLEKNKWGKRTINYKLRDWLISRQRFWGTPIPIIYCDKCGSVPVPEKDLPVELPDPKLADFSTGGNPLETVKDFVNAKCPKCGGLAKRDTDTMDTFVDSSWYFLRYTSPKSTSAPFDKKAVDYWAPVNQYIGGIEHAILHLLYARFFTKVLRDEGFVSIDEPFERLLTQGMVLKEGVKMSKSLGNTVDPSEVMGDFGPDTIRLFILFASHPESEMDWTDKGVEASHKFLQKVNLLFETKSKDAEVSKIKKNLSIEERLMLSKTHSAIKKVSEQIAEYKFNFAISSIMELVNFVNKSENIDKSVLGFTLEAIAKMLVPFTPHLAEELFALLGGKGFVSLASWPEFNEKLIDSDAEATEKMIQLIKEDVCHIQQLAKISVPKKVTICVTPNWKWVVMEKIVSFEKKPAFGSAMKIAMGVPEAKNHSKEVQGFIKILLQKFHDLKSISKVNEFKLLSDSKDILSKTLGCETIILDANKAKDPKAQKAFPLKPAIIIE